MPRVQVDPDRVSIPGSSNLPIGVRFVKLDGMRELVTIRPTDRMWTDVAPTCRAGSIVRLQPPAAASDADVQRVREGLVRAGAERVRVEPRATGEKVVASPFEDLAYEWNPKHPRRAIRETVMSMADEARTHNRQALRAELERALSEEGI
jgi:hypothetical protein